MKRNYSRPDHRDAIAQVLERLREELAVVREVLDDIRDELQCFNRNRDQEHRPASPLRRITSMPLDPTASDWAERLNRYSAADLPAETEGDAWEDVRPPRQQGRLF